METKHPNIPTLPGKLLTWYCGNDSAEDLLGDLDELYVENLKRMSPRRAKIKYWIHTLSLIFSYAARKRRSQMKHSPSNFILLPSYGKIAIRSMARQKVFSLINVICLSVGMSVGLMALAAYIDVKEVDDFQTKGENIYRITTTVDNKHDKITYASSSAPLAAQLDHEASGITEVVQIHGDFSGEVVNAGAGIPLSGYYATSNFFKVFDFELEEGNPATALSHPYSIILTKVAAKKLFNSGEAIGKTISVEGLGEFVITGIMKDYPRSHFSFESLASFGTLESLEKQGRITQLQDWGPRTEFYTYLLLSESKSADNLESILDEIAALQFEKNNSEDITFDLQQLSEIPTSDLSHEIGLGWGYASLLVFFFLAILVLLPACFNYSNISIARALKRAKEIGLRKVSGGQTGNIFLQMIMETVILSLIALIGGIVIFLTVRNQFLNMVVGGNRAFDLEITPLTFIVFVVFAIVTGILAGIFPAAYFSKLNPVETLRNASLSGKLSKVNVRKGLIVFQFVLSLVFILSIVILTRQYQYALHYDLGFQKDNILEVPLGNVNPDLFKAELEKIPEVSDISMASSIPGSWSSSEVWVKTSEGSDSLSVSQMFVDENFIHCMEISLLAGKSFPQQKTQHEEYIIVNETFLKNFRVPSPHAALDSIFIIDDKSLRIIGVVKDFNHMPLHMEISSFFFRYQPEMFAFANVKVASQDITATLARIEDAWNIVAPGATFEYYFLDSQVRDSLVSLRSMLKIFGFLGALAVIISCLGLLAVVISTSESRIREMGVRKIFGATTASLAMVLCRGYAKLIALAIMIATPLTYFLFEKMFLRIQFYRASVGVLEILMGIVVLLVLVILTIGGQTLKVAKVNPVETLKYE